MNILRINRKRKNKFKFKSSRLLVIIILLMMTTLAWFTYSRILNEYVNLHINSWNIEFYLDGVKQEVNEPINVRFDGLYPGMEDREIIVGIKNIGETSAFINYTISDLNIFGNNYQVVENPLVDNEYYIMKREPVVEGIYSNYDYLVEEGRIPFTIQIESTTEANSELLVEEDTNTNPDVEPNISPNPASDTIEDTNTTITPRDDILEEYDGYFVVKVKWPGEDDELDIKWGRDSALYYQKIQDGTIKEDKGAINFNLKLDAYGKPRDEGV